MACLRALHVSNRPSGAVLSYKRRNDKKVNDNHQGRTGARRDCGSKGHWLCRRSGHAYIRKRFRINNLPRWRQPNHQKVTANTAAYDQQSNSLFAVRIIDYFLPIINFALIGRNWLQRDKLRRRSPNQGRSTIGFCDLDGRAKPRPHIRRQSRFTELCGERNCQRS
jgi:hypothetical protein